MKKLLALLFLLTAITPAHAASKPLNQLVALGDVTRHGGLLIDKATIYTFGNLESRTSDAVITAFDSKGAILSQRIIDGGGSDYISAGVSDGVGNFWFVGGDSPALTNPPIDTATVGAVNPDGVVVEEIPALRGDIQNLVLWKYSIASGEIVRFAYSFGVPVLATSLAVDSKAISVIGVYGAKTGLQNFLLSASLAGTFSKPVPIGGTGTTINALLRNADGTVDLFGSSTEPLAGTKRAGRVDGVLIKVRGSKVVQVVRSSAPQATREWVATGAGTFLVGTIRSGKAINAVATKFSGFKPVWTIRYPSTGNVAGFLNSTGAYFAYSTQSGLTLSFFSTKGVVGPSYTSQLPARPISLAYSKEVGLLALVEAGNQAVILTPTSG